MDKNAYLASLFSAKPPVDLAPHELRAFERLKALGGEVEKIERQINTGRTEIERLEVARISVNGQASALAEYLWTEHVASHGTKLEVVATEVPSTKNGKPGAAQAPSA